MRVVALLATYNEERFITACLGHLTGHGVEVYLIDNESTDRTVQLAERFRGRREPPVFRPPLMSAEPAPRGVPTST